MLVQRPDEGYMLIRPQDRKTPVLLIYAKLLICRAAWLEIPSVVGDDLPQVPAKRSVPWMVYFV
jgi:hypothetical protein